MSIAIKRNFTIPSTSAIGASELYLTSSTASTTIGTGALQVAGGAGVNGVISLGGELKLFNGSFYTGFDSAATANTTYIWPATSPSTGTSVLSSDAAGNLSWILMSASGSGLTLNGLTATTQYFSTSISGSGFTIGSIGSTHTYYIGLAGNASTGLISSSSQTLFGLKTFASGVAITSGIASTNTTTGDLVVSGGVGIGDSLFVAGTISVNTGTSGLLLRKLVSGNYGAIYSTGITPSATNYSMITDGASVNFNGTNGVYFNINNTNKIQVTTNNINIVPTAGSSSTSTGALTVSGGVGIGGSLWTSNDYYSSISGVGHLSGVITSGVWSGTAISAVNGGTGLTTYSIGDIVYASSSTTLGKITAGSAGSVLTSAGSGSTPYWALAASTGVTSINGLTASTQSFSTSISGSGFTIGSTSSTHTYYIGLAGNASTGLISSASQTLFGAKTFASGVAITSGTASTSTTTGDLVVSGGVGIGGTVFTNGLNIQDIFTLGSQIFYPQNTRGFSVNENYNPVGSGASHTGYHFASGVGRSSIYFDLAISNQYTVMFGTYGSSTGNTFVIGSETANSDFEFRSTVGIQPVRLDLGTLLMRINRSGNVSIPASTASTSTSSGTLTVTGGVGIGGSLWTSTTNFSSISGVGHLNGAITSGIWSGTAISAVNGGTGIVSYTTGDILYATSSTTLGKIAAGTAGSILTSAGAGSTPYWAVATVGSATGLTLNGLTAATQFFASSISGSGFTIGSTGSTHTFYIALAGNASTGLISGAAQTIFGLKTFGSGLAITSGTASTNTTTGALTVAGGVGITGQLSVNTIALGTTAVSITPSMIFSGTAGTVITMSVLSDTTLAWEGSSGQLFSIDNNLSSGEIFSVSDISGLPVITASAGQTITLNEFGGFTQVGNGLASTNTTTGALRVIGGVGITGSLYLGSPLLIPSGGTGLTTYTTGDILYASSSTTLARITAGTAGSVLTSAGAGSTPYWALSTGSGGGITLNGLIATTQTFATSISGSGFTIGSATSTHTFYIGLAGNASTGLISSTVQTIFGLKTFGSGVAITSGTTSTSTSTGDLVVTGGVGIGASVNIGGKVGINTGVYTGAFNITTPSASTPGLVVQGSNSQTADYLQLLSSAGATSLRIDKDGKIIFPQQSSIQLFAESYSSTGRIRTSGPMIVYGSISSLSDGVNESYLSSGTLYIQGLQWTPYGSPARWSTNNAVRIQPTSTSVVPLVVQLQNASWTSGNAFEIQNNGVLKFNVDYAGNTSILSTTGSGSTSTGALVVSGGVGIGGSLNIYQTTTANDNVLINAAKEIRFYNSSNTFYTGIKAGLATSSTTFTLPIVDGTANQVLYTNGSSALGWTSITTGITSLNGLTASTQTFSTSISGSGFTIGSSTSTHTFYIGLAGNASTGLISAASQSLYGVKTLVNDLIISSSTASTSTSTGALTVTGGVGIGGSLWTSTTNFSSISGVGHSNSVITSGVWSGTAISAVNGGTGLASYTTGDILHASSSTTLGRISAGTAGSILTSAGSGATPYWAASGSGSGTVNSGAQFALAYYPTLGTTVTDASALTYAPAGTHLIITSNLSTDVPLRVDGHTSSFVNLFQVRKGASDQLVINSSGNVSILSSTASTNTTTGALVVSGGVGIGQTLNVSGNIYQNTNAITAYDTGFRNRIINGDGNIDQRNGGTSTTPTSTTNFIDRWKMNVFGSGRLTIGQNYGGVTVPDGFVSYIGMKTTTTSTPSANDYNFLTQMIEGSNLIDLQFGTANAKSLTISFWAYSSLTGTFGGSIRNSSATRSYPFTYTISSSNTWEKKTVVIPGDTTGTWSTSHLGGLEIIFVIANGTTWQATPFAWVGANATGPSGSLANLIGTLNATLYLTGIQVEIGSVATPYERRNYGHEFALCQRYYQITEVRTGGYHTTGGELRGSGYLNAAMRPITSPVLTILATDESVNLGTLNVNDSNFRGDSFRYIVAVTSTGTAYGQWKVSCDTEF